MKAAVIHLAALLSLTWVAMGCACNRVHRAADTDASDSAIVDGAVDGGVNALDANGDASVQCDFDLAGTWSRTFDRSPGQCLAGEDGPIEVTTGGHLAGLESVCDAEGCTPENCEVLPATSPDCTAIVRFGSPCMDFPRGVSYEEVHRVVSSNRIEGTFYFRSDLGECPQDYVLTR